MFEKKQLLNVALSIIFLSFTASKTLYAKEAQPEKSNKVEKKYKGSIDFGASFANGNSKEESIQSNLDLNYQLSDKTSNIFKARGQNKKANRIRTSERYYANNQTQYHFNKTDFYFVELEYVNDRYSGYAYRNSETVGIGKKLLEDKKFTLSIQSSAGLRQSKLITNEKENDLVIRAGSNFSANLNDLLTFSENVDISTDSNATILRSDTNLRILISKKLYLKLGVLFQRISNVPTGRKNSDITTALKIGYSF